MTVLTAAIEMVRDWINGREEPELPASQLEHWTKVPAPKPPTLNSIQIASLTVWAEARGEPPVGQEAVTWIIKNRAEHPRWWGNSIESVCLKKWQFSCWWDAQRERLEDPTTLELDSYQAVHQRVLAVFNGLVPDPTRGCDHYCTTRCVPTTKWAKKDGVIRPHMAIGNHSFFKLELP